MVLNLDYTSIFGQSGNVPTDNQQNKHPTVKRPTDKRPTDKHTLHKH